MYKIVSGITIPVPEKALKLMRDRRTGALTPNFGGVREYAALVF